MNLKSPASARDFRKGVIHGLGGKTLDIQIIHEYQVFWHARV